MRLGLSQGPWFVVRKDTEENIIYVAHQDSLERHGCRNFQVVDPHWIALPPDREDLQVKLRHSEHLYDCRVSLEYENLLDVTLDTDDYGVAPGQFAVFYDGEVCLGGARIR